MLELLREYDILAAFIETIKYTLLGAAGAFAIGSLVALLRVSPVPLFQRVGAAYVSIVRNTPLTLLMVMSVLGLSFIVGLQISQDFQRNSFWWAVIMLSLYHAAFVAEALRSGVNTIPLGQAEAARSLGLSFTQNISSVIAPQAFRAAIAPLGSTLIALTKNTTVASVIGGQEAAGLLKEIVENEGSSLGAFALIAFGFVLLTLPTGLLFTYLSERWAVRA